MEREDESPSPVAALEGELAEEKSRGQGWLADGNRSDGEALALHEI
jgi:hypothetical protein